MGRVVKQQLAKLLHGHYRNAVVVVTIAVAMSGVFVASYSLALGRPQPHHIPAALVGNAGQDPRLIVALDDATKGGVQLQPMSSETQAEQGIAQQRIYAALVLTTRRPRLLISSASGTSVARVLEQGANAVALAGAGPLDVRDLHPLPPGDPQGLVAFYAALAATVLGFVSMFQLRANASGLSLRAWCLALAAVATLGGLLLAVIVGPLIGALPAPLYELWPVLSVEIAIAALFNSTMITLVGRWAIIPTWGFFVAFGNASSGGAVAPPLLPSFYGFVSRFIPAGATVELIRNATYFRGHQQLEPVVVQACWLAGTAAAFVLAVRLRGRTPAAR